MGIIQALHLVTFSDGDTIFIFGLNSLVWSVIVLHIIRILNQITANPLPIAQHGQGEKEQRAY